jgi:hypothetical protein
MLVNGAQPPILSNPDRNNPLYKRMIQLLNEGNSVYTLVDYLKENNIFSQETLLDELYDGVIFQIPLKEWNEKTGMNIQIDETKFYHDKVPTMIDILDNYMGTIMITTVDEENQRSQYVCIFGGY